MNAVKIRDAERENVTKEEIVSRWKEYSEE